MIQYTFYRSSSRSSSRGYRRKCRDSSRSSYSSYSSSSSRSRYSRSRSISRRRSPRRNPQPTRVSTGESSRYHGLRRSRSALSRLHIDGRPSQTRSSSESTARKSLANCTGKKTSEECSPSICSDDLNSDCDSCYVSPQDTVTVSR